MLLLDNFCERGTDFQDFLSVNHSIAESTHEISVKTAELTYYSLCTIPEATLPGSVSFFEWNEEALNYFLNTGKFTLKHFQEISKEFLDELKSGSQLMVKDQKGIFYLVAPSAIGDLCKIAGACGDTTINKADMLRNAHLAASLIGVNQKVTLVVRQQECVGKIFSVAGRNYSNISQATIGKLMYMIYMRELAEIEHWEITHKKTKVKLLLGEEEEGFQKGFILETSDTGKSSWNFQLIWGVPKTEGYIIVSEERLYHTKGTTEAMVEEKAISVLKNQKSLGKMLKGFEKRKFSLPDVLNMISSFDLPEKHKKAMREEIEEAQPNCENLKEAIKIILSAFPKELNDTQAEKLRNSMLFIGRKS